MENKEKGDMYHAWRCEKYVQNVRFSQLTHSITQISLVHWSFKLI
jgi:hypothetical protein